jgi:hypothetical protein
METSHHPSCKSSDMSLVWHCYQCGSNEGASYLQSRLAEAEAWIAKQTCEKPKRTMTTPMSTGIEVEMCREDCGSCFVCKARKEE